MQDDVTPDRAPEPVDLHHVYVVRICLLIFIFLALAGLGIGFSRLDSILAVLRTGPPPGRAGLATLAGALRAYTSEYGSFPDVRPSGKGMDYVLSDSEYDSLIECLSAQSTSCNPKGIVFLEPPTGKVYVDDWGSRYRVAVDGNGDGTIAAGAINGRKADLATVDGFVIWSLGPDRKEEIPFRPAPTGKNEDNINGFVGE